MKCPACHANNAGESSFCSRCGAKLPRESASLPTATECQPAMVRELSTGSTFADRYEIIEELGRGGMGRVYKVFDKKVKEKVALKLIRPEIACEPDAVERFSQELKLARGIVHKSVCRMFDLGEHEGIHYITMEYIRGEDLKSIIHMMGRLSPGQAVSIARQVCEGLSEAHRLGIVHRDLKPRNIMIDPDGNAKIMDFGLARCLRTRGITDPGAIMGTPEYMSPEQVDGQQADKRSDIYALGIVLY